MLTPLAHGLICQEAEDLVLELLPHVAEVEGDIWLGDEGVEPVAVQRVLVVGGDVFDDARDVLERQGLLREGPQRVGYDGRLAELVCERLALVLRLLLSEDTLTIPVTSPDTLRPAGLWPLRKWLL